MGGEKQSQSDVTLEAEAKDDPPLTRPPAQGGLNRTACDDVC